MNDRISLHCRRLGDDITCSLSSCEGLYAEHSDIHSTAKELNIHTAYYSAAVTLTRALERAEHTARDISAELCDADALCDTETVSALGELLEMYFAHRNSVESFLNAAESLIKSNSLSHAALFSSLRSLMHRLTLLKGSLPPCK